METEISRKTSQQIVTVPTGAALSNAVDIREFAGGVFITPATLDATTVIAFQVSDSASGTFTDLRKSDNTLATVTVELNGSHAYPLVDELFGAQFFKFWCQASGTGVNQTGDKVFNLNLKG